MRKIFSVCSFFLTFYFIALIAQQYCPVDEATNTVQVPAWLMFVVILVPLFVARTIWTGNAKTIFKVKIKPVFLTRSKEMFRVPLSRKARNSIALELLYDVNIGAEKANKCCCVSEFVKIYDNMLVKAEKLSALDGYITSVKRDLRADYRGMERDFDRALRDVIERNAEKIVALKQGLLEYEPDIIEEKILEFKGDIEAVSDRADNETNEFAQIKYRWVCEKCNMQYLKPSTAGASTDEGQLGSTTFSVDDELKKIDAMDGHSFEHWCADLLKKSKFLDVSVTRGSGDQGVDVLAEKDGVKYAIQCKCYSSDLGNTPVQEVNAGRIIYHCHIGAVMTNRHFTAGAKKAAEATGTLLWDRDTITKMLEEVEI